MDLASLQTEKQSLVTTLQWRPTDKTELVLDVNYLKQVKEQVKDQIK